ncbi:hypothetical protein EYF80_057555 [Liparis tanakae]|uniref:Uncharacterized protein n=1 Tax=Liparis tanakae TaxID=230148 RepID=A0A4Z2EV99_9TELE|nr:hypothetical protein EYF80_057555 [Liparis tanakae]
MTTASCSYSSSALTGVLWYLPVVSQQQLLVELVVSPGGLDGGRLLGRGFGIVSVIWQRDDIKKTVKHIKTANRVSSSADEAWSEVSVKLSCLFKRRGLKCP